MRQTYSYWAAEKDDEHSNYDQFRFHTPAVRHYYHFRFQCIFVPYFCHVNTVFAILLTRQCRYWTNFVGEQKTNILLRLLLLVRDNATVCETRRLVRAHPFQLQSLSKCQQTEDEEIVVILFMDSSASCCIVHRCNNAPELISPCFVRPQQNECTASKQPNDILYNFRMFSLFCFRRPFLHRLIFSFCQSVRHYHNIRPYILST